MYSCSEFPVPVDVLLEAEKWQRRNLEIQASQTLLDRPVKPEDSEIPGELRSAAARSGVTKAEIAQWLEEGKAKARARYAELAKDPKWREQQAAAGVPEYRRQAEAAMAERNGPSTVPADPSARRSWAREKAASMGWIPRQSREAGDELK
jgi:hypothetical protein